MCYVSYSTLSYLQKAYQDEISGVIDPDHAVRSLLWRRVMTFIYTSQSHSSSIQRLQLPQGFGSVSQDIAQYAAKVTHQNLH